MHTVFCHEQTAGPRANMSPSIAKALLIFSLVSPAFLADPEVDMGAADIIRRWDYPVEEYDVTTKDGYILTIFRIPHGQNGTGSSNGTRPVVFFMHGLEADCIMWISNLPSQNGPFIFADHGFDVWLGNFRGNQYGKRHTVMKSNEHEFWKFSWDQMAEYDLPTMLNFVHGKTGSESIYLVGHSMGTLTAFAAFSEDQELGKKIKRFYGLAPLITVGHIQGFLRTMADILERFEWVVKTFGTDQFAPPSWLSKKAAIFACGIGWFEPVCSNTVFMMAGPESNQLNQTRMPVYMANTPAGTSTRNVIHFSQMVRTNQFQKFDGGKKENQAMYNSETPPIYNVTQMETPVSLYYGSNDWLADPQDVNDMIPQLKNCVGKNFLKDFNHMDFMWGLRAADEIYLPIAKEILGDQ